MQETVRESFTCGVCGQEHPIDRLYTFDGMELCETCFENDTVICSCCGNRIWAEDAEADGQISLCLPCYERYYTHCSSCGRLIHEDDAYYHDDSDDDSYCYSCFEHSRISRKHIQSYCYKPMPIFYGEGNRFFGAELEIDDGGESNDNAAALMQIANEKAEHIYCKHDGSIENGGFEIVTHPMTLDYHINEMPWASVMEEAIHMGYRSHQSGCCGLHVHVNRDTFGETEEQQDCRVARILYFVENFWNELLRFSRRTRGQMQEWASRYGRKDSPKEQIDHVKTNFSDRYRAVNLTNRDTIEFRLFRGTLRYNTFVATLQLVNEICELACRLSDDEMANLTWSDFCARVGNLNYPELIQYLKERRLYVNEPVAGEVEI